MLEGSWGWVAAPRGVAVPYDSMSRYRKELTHPERDISRLAEATRQLRQELEDLVRDRRRSDRLVPERSLAPEAPSRKKPRR